MGIVNVREIRDADNGAKPGGGVAYDRDAIQLSQLYLDQSRSLTCAYLRERRLGRPNESTPAELPFLRRIVDARALAYLVPPVRKLQVKGVDLPDDSPAMKALSEVYAGMQMDLAMANADQARHLLGSIVLMFQPSSAHGRVVPRVFESFNVVRMPDPVAADVLSRDKAFLLQIRSGADKSANLYEAWVRDGETWRCWIVDEDGELAKDVVQPYGDSGTLPWGGTLPGLMLYESPPFGRPYLPLQTSRISRSLAINALVNDILFLVEMEGHSPLQKVSDKDAPPSEPGGPVQLGPGKIADMPPGSRLEALALSPHLSDDLEVLEALLRFSATCDYLPADEFKAEPSVASGAAQRAREKPLATLRARSMPLLVEAEKQAYRIVSAVHNVYAGDWGLPLLDEKATLRLELGRPWEAADAKELQDRLFRDLQIGACSILDYLSAVHGIGRSEAQAMWERVQADRKLYPVGQMQADVKADVVPTQNPGALVTGPKVAGGVGSGTKNPEAVNLDPQSNNERASVVGAVMNMT